MSTVAGVKPVRFLIGGQWIQDKPSHITHVNPATGEVTTGLAPAPKEHIDAAVKTAHAAASKAQWRAMLPQSAPRSCTRLPTS